MEQKPTPDQLERARRIAGEVAKHPDGSYWEDDYRLALSAILQSDHQQAELLAHAEAMAEALSSYARVLLPVFMSLAEREMVGEPVPDESVLFSFMGSGASDYVTVGEYRKATKGCEQIHTAFREWQGGRDDG